MKTVESEILCQVIVLSVITAGWQLLSMMIISAGYNPLIFIVGICSVAGLWIKSACCIILDDDLPSLIEQKIGRKYDNNNI